MMKKASFGFAVLLALIIIPSLAFGQSNNGILALPKVDNRTELVSIVFRLAGNTEYNNKDFKGYVQDIHEYFDSFKSHEAVRFASEMREKHGVGYDAVAAISFYLEPLPSLAPTMPFSDEAFSRWGGAANAQKFVMLLQQFAKDTRCEEFFRRHEELYVLAERRFKEVYDSLDVDWFINYYGTKPTGKLIIIIGLGNGGCNYGPKVINQDKTEDCYAVMGTWSFDSLGMPKYSASNYLSTLIHEFNHSFVNCINEKHQAELEASATKIFDYCKYNMQRQAYPIPIYMLNEALVRACVVQYCKSHNNDSGASIRSEIEYQIGTGFIWVGMLADKLDYYEKNRDKYPTLEEFAPELIAFYYTLSADADKLFGQCPRVASIEPFANSADSVDPGVKELKICFDKPLLGKGYSIWRSNCEGAEFPIAGNRVRYEDGNKSLVISLALKSNTLYEFILVGSNFKSVDGFPLMDYVVTFKTK